MHLSIALVDVLDTGTASDSISPLGLSWFRIGHTAAVEVEEYQNFLLRSAPVETILLCAFCSIDTPCEGIGNCNYENGTCSCDLGFEGPLCEVEPPCIVEGNCTNDTLGTSVFGDDF